MLVEIHDSSLMQSLHQNETHGKFVTPNGIHLISMQGKGRMNKG
jgi:hypothetical protein